MKKFLLVVLFLLFTIPSFAAVTAEIISTDIDSNGNIIVWTCHKVDGVEVASPYPKINNHFVYATRYSKQNFSGCSNKNQVETYILNDVKNYSHKIVGDKFNQNAPKTIQQIKIDYNHEANESFALDNLDEIVGKNTSVTEAEHLVDTDNDGALDKKNKD